MLLNFSASQLIEHPKDSPTEMVAKIKVYLKKEHADNVESQDGVNLISFYNTHLKLGSNLAYMTGIKKGSFQLKTTEHGLQIDYSFYISIWVDLILIIFCLLAGIFINKTIIAFSIMLLFQMIYRIASAKRRGETFLNEMLSQL